MDPFTILISHDGNCYCLSHRNKRIRWSYQMNPPSTYNVYRAEDAEEYMEARVDEDGKISIFHNSQCIHMSEDNMDQYLSYYSPSDMMHERYEDVVKLGLTSGDRVDDHVDRPSGFLEIRRIQYIMAAPQWRLDFSIFEASYTWQHDKTTSTVSVWHTLTQRNFMDACQRLNDYTNSSGATMEDLNLHLELVMMYQIIRSPRHVSKECDELVRGTINGFDAAIQVFDNIAKISSHYKTLLQLKTTPHDNILAFLGVDMDVNGKYQFAFERFNNTMSYFVCSFNVEDKNECLLNFLRGVVQGISHLHKLKLAHGNLNPWNVLITWSGIPKLWGLNRFAELTNESRYLEYMKLAKLIIYSFSDHLSAISKDDYMNLNPKYKHMNREAKEAQDVAKKLINEGENIVNLEWILNHPWLWTCDKRLLFIKDVHELISISGSPVDKTGIDGLAAYCWDTKKRNGGWHKCFERELIKLQDPPTQQGTQKYIYTSVCSLLRFMRNIYSYHLEIGSNLESRLCGNYLGATNASLELEFRKAFPNLLIGLYHELQDQHLENHLPNYYDFN